LGRNIALCLSFIAPIQVGASSQGARALPTSLKSGTGTDNGELTVSCTIYLVTLYFLSMAVYLFYLFLLIFYQPFLIGTLCSIVFESFYLPAVICYVDGDLWVFVLFIRLYVLQTNNPKMDW